MFCLPNRYRIRITVLKRYAPKAVFLEPIIQGSIVDACTVFKEGQEFIVDESGRMPEGFCSWAWDDLSKVVNVLRFGGDFPWYEEKGVSVNCCTDGLRPVIFKLERADEKGN